ncbi:MAG: FG-GAP-like repeat-containing protein [Akkermansiaceae bacterium]
MNFNRTVLSWILPLAFSQAAIVNFAQTSVNDVDISTISAVTSSAYLETGMIYSTLTAPAVSTTFSFTHWTNDSYDSTVYRDAWGRSLNPISFRLLEDTTCTAHYLPTTRDSDSDGVADWFEIEYYGNLDNAAASDTDSDGYSLLVERQGGHHPLYANSTLAGGVAGGVSGLVTANLAGYPSYTLTSVPSGTVDIFAIQPPGTVITSPDLSANAAFGYWTLDGVRQADAWGVGRPQLIFTMGSVNRAGVAYLFNGDSDRDGVSDAWEQYYYNSLTNDASSDTDGDGLNLLVEYQGGYQPLYANTHQAGGVSAGSSGLVTVNLAGYSRYTLTSNPVGTVNQSAVVPDGTVITTANMTQSNFGYWTLDGVQQRDAWGAALRQISFTVNGADRNAVAYLLADDSDADSINDGYEMYHYGNLDQNGSSDTDADGMTLLVESQSGSNPIYANTYQAGGVSSGRSGMVVANLQPYERLDRNLIDGTLAVFFSSNPGVVTGILAGTYSAPAATDWDGDGDQDLFIAHEEGMRVFRNIGTAFNPNFSEITTGFSSLISYVTSITKPAICGGDWNGDGKGDLVIGGQTGSLRFIASSGAFSATASGSELIITGSTRALPALGDMDADGRLDLLLLLDDGTVRLYLNNGDAMPFVGDGSDNYLGVAAPSAISIASGDIDDDGVTDVLLADDEGRIWEFLNEGGGSFNLMSKVWGGSYQGFASGLALAAIDIEGDGDLDLIGGLANGGLISLRDPSVGRPTGLVARPGANSVQLDWNPSWQSRIRGYHVYRSGAEVGPFDRLTNVITPLPSYLDSPVAAASNYYYVTGISQFFVPGNSTPRISESLPSDFAVTSAGKVILSVRPVRGKPNNKVKINLAIENAIGVSGENMQLKVAYDPAKLLPYAQTNPGQDSVKTTGLSRNLVFTDNGTTANGELIINGTGGSMEPGAGKFFTLEFSVNANVPNGSKLGVSITSVTMFDLLENPLNVEILALEEPEAGETYTEGDVDGDGFVTVTDIELLTDLTKPKSRLPTANELMAGDLNGDGKLDVKDFVLLVQLLNEP